MFSDSTLGTRNLVVRFVLIVGAAVACLLGAFVSAKETVQPLERITVVAGSERARFVLKRSKKPFFVTGFNYIRLRGDHASFDAATEKTEAHYDPKKAEAMFRTLSQSGYNTVRVFILIIL